MTRHPKALIRYELQKAGIPSADLHALTERIAAAYDDANPALPPGPGLGRFEVVESDPDDGDDALLREWGPR